MSTSINDYDIKTKRFLVSVPTIHLKSDEELSREGVYITGNKIVDKDLLSRRSNVLITIDDMSKFHEKGVGIAVIYPNDKETIYRAIEKYINDWILLMENSSKLNMIHYPEQELIRLDELAKGIFNHNRTLMREINVKDNHIFGDNAITPDTMFKQGVVVDSHREEIKRNSFEEFLENNLKELSRYKGLNK